MAKIYGTLVGALIQSGTGFAGVAPRYANTNDTMLIRDVVATLGNVVNDLVSLGVFKSTALIRPASTIWFGAAGAGCTMNVGDVNHATGLVSGLDISAAGSASLWKAFTAAKAWQPLWQALGYATDPGGTLELLAKFTGANPADATSIAWEIVGRNE